MIADQIRCGQLAVVQMLFGAAEELKLVKIFMQLMLADIYQRISFRSMHQEVQISIKRLRQYSLLHYMHCHVFVVSSGCTEEPAKLTVAMYFQSRCFYRDSNQNQMLYSRRRFDLN